MSEILEVRQLDVSYARSQVLFGVRLSAPRSGGVAILGRNGAGKTTLLKAIAGELRHSGGSIWYDGVECSSEPTERRVRRGLGYVPQEHGVFSRLSVRENLEMGMLRAHDRSGIDRVLATFPKLGKRLSQAAGTLSGGERKMLAISRALLLDPKVIMLDEPTEGVWIGVIEEIAECLQRLAREISVVIVEQHLDLALRVADHAYVIDRGQVVLEGPSERVRSDPQLLRYLAP